MIKNIGHTVKYSSEEGGRERDSRDTESERERVCVAANE
jgi:hypothetical protein